MNKTLRLDLLNTTADNRGRRDGPARRSGRSSAMAHPGQCGRRVALPTHHPLTQGAGRVRVLIRRNLEAPTRARGRAELNAVLGWGRRGTAVRPPVPTAALRPPRVHPILLRYRRQRDNYRWCCLPRRAPRVGGTGPAHADDVTQVDARPAEDYHPYDGGTGVAGCLASLTTNISVEFL